MCDKLNMSYKDGGDTLVATITLSVLEQASQGGGKHITVAPDNEHWGCLWSNSIYLWHNTTFQQKLHLDSVNCGRPRFSSDSKTLYVGTRVYNLEQHTATNLPISPDSLSSGIDSPPTPFTVNASAWSPDVNQWVAYVEYRPLRTRDRQSSYTGISSRVLVLDGQSYQHLATLTESTSRIEYKTLAVSSKFIIGSGLPVIVWDSESYDQIAELEKHDKKLLDICFSPDEDKALTSDGDGKVVLWDTATWEPLYSWQAHDGGTHTVAFHPDTDFIATGSEDGFVRVWDLSDEPQEVASLQLPAIPVGVAFHPSLDWLLTADNEGNVIIAEIAYR